MRRAWRRGRRDASGARATVDHAVVAAVQDAADAADPASALQLLVDRFAAVLDVERVEMRVGRTLHAAGPSPHEPSPPDVLDRIAGLASAPLHLTSQELATHPQFGGDAFSTFRGVLAAPLAGGVEGIVVATGKRRGEFGHEDEDVIALVARLAPLPLELVRQRSRAAQAEERLERFLHDSPLAVAVQDDRGIVFANDEAHRLLGLPPGGLVGETPANPVWDLVREDGTPLPVDELPSSRARTTGTAAVGIIGLRHRLTRERRFGLVGAHPLMADASEVLSIGADITDQVRSRVLQERQRRILTAIAEGAALDGVLDALCLAADELIEGAFSSLLLREQDHVRFAAGPKLGEEARATLDGLPVGRDGGPCGLAAQWGEPVVVADIARDPAWEHMREAAARHGWGACWAIPFRRRDDTVLGALVVHHAGAREPSEFEWDVLEALTDLARIAIESDRAHRDLQSSREAAESASERFRALIEAAPLAIFEVDLAGDVRLWNRAAEQMFGWRRDEVIGRPPPIIPPDDRGAYLDIQARVARGETLRGIELQRRRRDGSLVEVALAAAPLFDEDGSVHGGLAMMADISDQRRLEAQLLRAQRMEAVGRLAGGIAHDFNNLLTAIQGHVEFLMEEAKDEATLHDLEAVRLAASRGAKLTAQLLAVGRRQLVRPEVVDLGEVVHTMQPLLERLLGEQVRVSVVVSPGVGGVRIDPVQIEQVVLNLAVNARDAMPEGGRLDIVVSEVALDAAAAPPELGPGRYVRLAVRDTGTGMDAETAAAAFEPFFTTKDPSQGTGLGLAAAYGIVAQAGGHISVVSAPGAGSAFTILLPSVAAAPAAAAPAHEEEPAAGGHETVLLVEDEAPVRAVGRKVLERHGYAVLEAADAETALEVAADHDGAIDLLVTDVVLPRLGGLELAHRLTGERAKLRVLLVSGYADELPTDDETGFAFLAKPFGPNELARRVREVLDAPRF